MRARRCAPAQKPDSDEAADASAASPTLRQVAVDLAAPFVLSRIALFVVAWLVSELPLGLIWVAQFSQRGWAYTPIRWIDMWGRWDSDWYLRIIKHGYQVTGYATGEYTSLAFFPIYPETVRLLYRLLPTAWQGDQSALVLGIIVSNLCMVGALAVLYWHVRVRFNDRAMAQRTVAYLLAFPTAFFLGCVYSESTFMLLAVMTYHMGWRRRWMLAGLLGALLSATRPTGILLLLPLLWMKAEEAGFELRPFLRRIGWLGLVPTGFFTYGLYLWHLTGDVGAVFRVQRAWLRELSSPLALLQAPPTDYGHLVHLDRALILAFVAAAAWLTSRRAWRADGLVICAVVASFLFTGTPLSASRYLLVAFPVFVWLAERRADGTGRAYLSMAIAVQSGLWVLWVMMRWVA
jgi:hypothetical protein